MKSRWYGALAGIAAAGLAIGVAELVAVMTGARSAPLIAVGGVIVDAVPEPLKQFAIDVFGVHDKTALLIGTGVLLAGFAALVGVLATRRLAYGMVGIGVFAVIGVAAAVTRPNAGLATALPSLVGSAAAAGALWLLIKDPMRLFTTAPPEAPVAPGAAAEWARGRRDGGADWESGGVVQAPPEPPRPPGTDRRRFLTAAGLVLVGAAVSGFAGRFLSTRGAVTAAREAIRLPTPAGPPPVVPAGADLELSQLAPYVTPNFDFYRIDTALVVPQVDPNTWELRIHGKVRNPITLSYADLVKRPMVERYVTLACVSNEVGGDLIGNALWLGTPLKDLLDEAGPLDGADQVVGRSTDGWTCGTPTAVLRDGRDALLAIGMNGEPLPVAHGFPVRVVVPGLYGYVSACKWVVELELTSFADFDAYWVPRGWSALGPDQDAVPDRHAARPQQPDGGAGDRRRRGVGAAPRDRAGGGAGRRRRVATGHARPHGVDRHLGPMVLAVGRDPGLAHPAGTRDRRDRRDADFTAGRTSTERSHGIPQRRCDRRVTDAVSVVDVRDVTRRSSRRYIEREERLLHESRVSWPFVAPVPPTGAGSAPQICAVAPAVPPADRRRPWSVDGRQGPPSPSRAAAAAPTR